MADKTTQGGKKNRKHRRNKVWCEWYRATNRRKKNKVARMERTLKRQPNNRELEARLAAVRRQS